MIDEELPNVEPGQFSAPPDQKSPPSSSCLSWGLILAGGLTSLFGCVIAFGAASVQLETVGDWEGFSAFLLLCPLPIVVVGIILLILGALPLLKKRQIEDTQLN